MFGEMPDRESRREGWLASDLEAIQPTETEPYAHLDDASRIAAEEADRMFGADGDAPSHIESEGEGDVA